MARLGIIFFVFTTALMASASGDKCILMDSKEGSGPKRYFQLENDILNITIDSSDEIGQLLVTNIFSIFLKDVLNYQSVSIKIHQLYHDTVVLKRLVPPKSMNDDEQHSYQQISPEHRESENRLPEAMINLAVRLTPKVEEFANDDIGHYNIENRGHLGYQGRFGWFIPKMPGIENHQALDYWRTYKDSTEALGLFQLPREDYENATKLAFNGTSYYCQEEYCQDGFYNPSPCSKTSNIEHQTRHNHPCAILFAAYPQTSGFLKDQIESLGLRVRVLWIGPNLEPFVRHMAEKYNATNERKTLMFLSWNPNVLTLEYDLISVSFPPCNFEKDQDMFCVYESQKFDKFVWSKLREGAAPAHEAVHRMALNQDSYNSLLDLYKERSSSGESNLAEIACEWMKRNSSQSLWEKWIPPGDSNKVKIYIAGIFPNKGSYPDPGISLAASMATAAINNDSSILNEYTLSLSSYDGQCSTDMVMKKFIDYIRLPTWTHTAGILGPACSDTVEPLAGVARHFKTVVISYSAEGSSFSDREKYPYFFRTIGENYQYKFLLLKLFQRLGWNRIAALNEEGQKYAEYLAHVVDLLEENGIEFIANRKFPRERPALNMSQYLQELKSKRARIIIGDFYDHSGYVWFLPVWFNPKWYDTDAFNKKSGIEPIPCNTTEMLSAINGHLSLEHAYFAPEDHIMQENMTVKDWRGSYSTLCNKKNVSTSNYGGYAYDAVWTYAYALEKLLKNSQSHIDFHSEKTTEIFVQLIKETNFSGVSGQINFHGGPSRITTINVVQWINGNRTKVGSFIPSSNSSHDIIDGSFFLNTTAIKWLTPDGSLPDDGSEPPTKCFLETLATALDVTCEVAIVIANVIGFVVIGGILIVCFIVIKRRYEQKVRMTQDYFKALGIDILSVSNVSALDKWEIPRDRVVINRKIGEGAFGTVYGGEAFFDDSRGWVAVAVKTLKVGSSCEQKLDFLSEAEVMKRFEHKNIVKLLGVCTKSEPMYTIMEFMLYGDLKTYLLARRHLVNENNWEDSDEISSKRLTSMTLDVARALSYLAESKYVHRDVACRNCLVNNNRIVKLGDFGLLRNVFENDYYRFNRKGMLPVRWMSPESLAMGMFTEKSDVWSFGVLLYEIITFGSFPYQGKSNNEVLDYVKSGKILPIPSGVNPLLEGLLKACWSLQPSKRPQGSEIVEFLANNPRIISPSLDIPLASVQLEGHEQHEIHIPDRLRKCASLHSKNNCIKVRNIRYVPERENSSNGENIPLTPNGKCNNKGFADTNSNQHSPYASLQHENSNL